MDEDVTYRLSRCDGIFANDYLRRVGYTYIEVNSSENQTVYSSFIFDSHMRKVGEFKFDSLENTRFLFVKPQLEFLLDNLFDENYFGQV